LFEGNKDSIGFDIVIGNPPYGVPFSKESKLFFKKSYISTNSNKDLKGSLDSYTIFIERGYNFLKKGANLHYIIPISITSSESVSALHNILENNCKKIQISSYSVRPKPVFENAVVNTSIMLLIKTLSKNEELLSTKMHRKNKEFNLQYLVNNLKFLNVKQHKVENSIPKISENIEIQILDKLKLHLPLSKFVDKENGKPVFYRTVGGRYFKIVTNYSTLSNKETFINFKSNYSDVIGCILSSNLSFWFYQIYGDNISWKLKQVLSFTIPSENLTTDICLKITNLYNKYLEDIERNANIRTVSESSKYTMEFFKEYKIGKSKHLIDEIDDIIGPLYGLTNAEIEFIKNYEIDYRISEDNYKVCKIVKFSKILCFYFI
jgi:hypothetical protein